MLEKEEGSEDLDERAPKKEWTEKDPLVNATQTLLSSAISGMKHYWEEIIKTYPPTLLKLTNKKYTTLKRIIPQTLLSSSINFPRKNYKKFQDLVPLE